MRSLKLLFCLLVLSCVLPIGHHLSYGYNVVPVFFEEVSGSATLDMMNTAFVSGEGMSSQDNEDHDAITSSGSVSVAASATAAISNGHASAVQTASGHCAVKGQACGVTNFVVESGGPNYFTVPPPPGMELQAHTDSGAFAAGGYTDVDATFAGISQLNAITGYGPALFILNASWSANSGTIGDGASNGTRGFTGNMAITNAVNTNITWMDDMVMIADDNGIEMFFGSSPTLESGSISVAYGESAVTLNDGDTVGFDASFGVDHSVEVFDEESTVFALPHTSVDFYLYLIP